MSWAKVDDRLHAHPKVRRAGLEAMGLWVLALSHVAAYLTDGRIELEDVKHLAGSKGPALAARLVAAGLWEPDGEGWRVHDYLELNPSAAMVKAERERKASAGRSGALSRWKGRAGDGTSHGTCHGTSQADRIGTASEPAMLPSRPVPSQIPPTPQGGQAPPPAGAGGSPAKESKQDKPEERYRRAFAAGVLAGAPGVPYSLGGRLGLPFLQGLTTHSRGLRGEELETWITSTVSRWRRTADGRYQAGWSPAAFLRWLNGPDSGALELAPAGDRPRTRIAPPPPSPVVGAR